MKRLDKFLLILPFIYYKIMAMNLNEVAEID